MVVTRRGLAAAGAGALLAAGCGSEEQAAPPDAELLGAILALERSLLDVCARIDGRLGELLAARVRDHVARLAAGGGGGQGGAASDPGGDPLAAALELQRRSMRACVAAIGLVRSPAARTLAADVLADGAQHASVLLDRLGRDPLQTAFPDGRGT